MWSTIQCPNCNRKFKTQHKKTETPKDYVCRPGCFPASEIDEEIERIKTELSKKCHCDLGPARKRFYHPDCPEHGKYTNPVR